MAFRPSPFAPPSLQLVAAVQAIWQAIHPDLTWGPMEDPTNISAIETCIDADRLLPASGFTTTGAAHYDWQRMSAESGVHGALAILAAHPSLQLV